MIYLHSLLAALLLSASLYLCMYTISIYLSMLYTLCITHTIKFYFSIHIIIIIFNDYDNLKLNSLELDA